MNRDKLTGSSSPCHAEGPSVSDTSELLNDRNVCFLEDHAASKSFQDHTEVASTNEKVDNGNKAVSQWKTLEEISSFQIHKTLDLTGSTKGCDRSKSTQRTYPANIKSKIPVQICKQYANGMEGKESGTFANGLGELTLATMQRGRGRQYWTKMQTVFRHIKRLWMDGVFLGCVTVMPAKGIVNLVTNMELCSGVISFAVAPWRYRDLVWQIFLLIDFCSFRHLGVERNTDGHILAFIQATIFYSFLSFFWKGRQDARGIRKSHLVYPLLCLCTCRFLA